MPTPDAPVTTTREIRWVPIAAAFLVAVASFTLSFFAQSEVAAALGAVPPSLAWLVPVTIDGGILAGSASVWASSARRAKKDPVAYFTVASLLTLSVVINVHHAADEGGLLGAVISGTPPVILLLCLELVAAQARRDAKRPTVTTTPPDVEPATQPEQKTPVPTPAPVAANTPATRPTAQLTNHTPPTPAPTTPTPLIKTSTPSAPRTTETKTPPDTPAVEQTPPPATSPPAEGQLTQTERIRLLFTQHIENGGDGREPTLARTIANQLDAPIASVRKVLAQERKKLPTG